MPQGACCSYAWPALCRLDNKRLGVIRRQLAPHVNDVLPVAGIAHCLPDQKPQAPRTTPNLNSIAALASQGVLHNRREVERGAA